MSRFVASGRCAILAQVVLLLANKSANNTSEPVMKLSAEISLYPLASEYIPIIKDFIAAISVHEDIEIYTNAMSTQVCGEYDRVFDIIRSGLQRSCAAHGKQVLVCKFIVGDLDIGNWKPELNQR
jgi:uncharacterized protein YqgV (UPF0045/DUF77 family)